jgi:hypothetical protein
LKDFDDRILKLGHFLRSHVVSRSGATKPMSRETQRRAVPSTKTTPKPALML